MNKEKSIILNKLLENDSNLKYDLLDLYEFNYCVEDNLDYEEHLTVNELQIVNYVLQKHNYQPIFDYVDEPVNHLICENLHYWAEELMYEIQLTNGTPEIEFRTDNHGDVDVNRLLKDDIQATGMYLILEAPNGSSVMAEIEFDEFNESKDSPIQYIKKQKTKISKEIQRALNDFDPDYEFDELWSPSGNISAREMLRILDEDQIYFQERIPYF